MKIAATLLPPNLVTRGNVRRVLLALALPVLGQEILNTTVGIVDTFLAGQISVEATSAVGLAAYVAWLAVMLFELVATATTALVSRSIGSGDPHKANRIANQSLGLAVFVGIGGCFLMYTMAPAFASWQGMSGRAYDIVVRYLHFEAVGYMANSVTLVACAALRGVGDMRTPMKVLVAVNALNMVISPLLVFGPGPLPAFGVDGIVVGTLVARFSGCLIIVVVLLRGRSGLRIDKTIGHFDVGLARRIMSIGLPAASDGALMWSGHFVFLAMIKRLADGAESDIIYAAHIIVIRVEALTYLPASAWAAACATMIGQALGAQKPRRARRVGHEAVMQCVLLSTAVVVLFYWGAEFVFSWMHTDPQVRATGIEAMRVAAFFQPMLAISIVYVGALRGAGETRSPLVVTLVSLIFIRMPLGYLFGFTFGYGLIGAWVGICGDMTLRAVLMFAVFVRGRWVKVEV
ncbi:MAG: MATE family efflux transporter [Phycisphaerae bacterium]|nr:MATE family efflux transporter [Phycisphaerae bacterium]